MSWTRLECVAEVSVDCRQNWFLFCRKWQSRCQWRCMPDPFDTQPFCVCVCAERGGGTGERCCPFPGCSGGNSHSLWQCKHLRHVLSASSARWFSSMEQSPDPHCCLWARTKQCMIDIIINKCLRALIWTNAWVPWYTLSWSNAWLPWYTLSWTNAHYHEQMPECPDMNKCLSALIHIIMIKCLSALIHIIMDKCTLSWTDVWVPWYTLSWTNAWAPWYTLSWTNAWVPWYTLSWTNAWAPWYTLSWTNASVPCQQKLKLVSFGTVCKGLETVTSVS